MNNKAFWNGDILWVTSKDMKTKYITESGLKVSAKGAAELQVLSPGALLIVVRSGILRHTLPVAINRKPCTINQDLKAISLYLPVMQEFIYDAIAALEKRILADYKKTGTTVESIIWDKFTQIMLPLPPLAEQQRIVSQIESLLQCVNEIDRESETLEKSLSLAKQKILDLAIRGKLVPQDPKDEPASELLKKIKAEKEALIKAGKMKRDKHESFIFRGDDNCYHENIGGKNTDITADIPFEIPSTWAWTRMISLGQTNIGLTYSPSDVTDKGTIILRSNNIQHGKLDFTDLVRVSCPIPGNIMLGESDILICARNGSKSLVGKCAEIPRVHEALSFGAFMAVFRSDFNKWVFHILNSNYFREYLFDSNSTQICQLTQDMLKKFLVPFPPLAEQKRIVSQIEKLFSLLETMRV